MKLKKLFLLFILAFPCNCIICGLGGICPFCKKYFSRLRYHKTYSCNNNTCRKKRDWGGTCPFCKEYCDRLWYHKTYQCNNNPKCRKASPCLHCGKKVKYLKSHYKWCPENTDNQTNEHSAGQTPPFASPADKIVIVITRIKKKKDNVKQGSLNKKSFSNDATELPHEQLAQQKTIPLPLGEETSLLKEFDYSGKTDPSSSLDLTHYQSQNLFEFKNNW